MRSITAGPTDARGAVAARRRESTLRGRPLVLAIDGSMEALAAARVAAALAADRGALPHVVRAIETGALPLPAPVPSMLAAADALIGADVHGADVRAARDELAGHLGRAVDWPVHVGLGAPGGLIARHAAELGAAIVVMGLRRHHRVDRALHDETTLHVMRAASCPVLGVTTALTVLPRCAVVGVDFGRASAHAARLALDVLEDGGTLVLAHVEPPGREPALDEEEDGGGGVVYALGVEAAFDRLVTDLAVPAGVAVRRVRVPGEAGRHVSESLFAVAEEHAASLIAVASRRHDWIDRVLLGSVTTELARDGRCSLLVVPPPPAARPQPLDALARAY